MPGHLAIVDNISFANVAQIRDTLCTELAALPRGAVEVDLTDLVVANSVAVALLVSIWRAANSFGQVVTFVNASEGLRNIIDFSGLTTVLTCANRG